MPAGAVTSPRRDFRVVLVDDHALFRESLELALTIEGYDVRALPLAEGGTTAEETLSWVLQQRPQVVLLDLDLGASGDGVALVDPLARAGVDVVVLTGETDRSRWGEALWRGARAVISKSATLREALGVVRRLHHGLSVSTVAEREQLVRHHLHERALTRALVARLRTLTRREADVLGELMVGRTVREIAAAARVSEATVRTQVKAVLAKLEVSSQVSAVGAARRVGWSAPTA
jgi:two-component system, NarL family, nitrate/nitrite response regulator NarL